MIRPVHSQKHFVKHLLCAGQQGRTTDKGIVLNERQGFVHRSRGLLSSQGEEESVPPSPHPPHRLTGSALAPLQHPGCTGWGAACATKAGARAGGRSAGGPRTENQFLKNVSHLRPPEARRCFPSLLLPDALPSVHPRPRLAPSLPHRPPEMLWVAAPLNHPGSTLGKGPTRRGTQSDREQPVEKHLCVRAPAFAKKKGVLFGLFYLERILTGSTPTCPLTSTHNSHSCRPSRSDN